MAENRSDQEPSNENAIERRTGWLAKFRYAAVGVLVAFKTESSFSVHLPVGVVVIASALFLQMSTVEVSILLLAVVLVLTAELFNTAIESIARATTKEFNTDIQKALDVSAGAVLVASVFAVLVGLAIFGSRLVSFG